MSDDYITMADRLRIHADIDGVRAGPERIEIAHAPDETHVETLPERLEDWIDTMVEGTPWLREYERGGAERHEWAGGRHHSPVLPSKDHTKGYELKCNLIKVL